ncbi:hypothetical protein DN748_09775 [Sinomicrobium soli]|nr:hypothetical protein DN748_09775 [Sinomicrobium sp. N-1-3-6]
MYLPNQTQTYYLMQILSLIFTGNFSYRLNLSTDDPIFNTVIRNINHMSELMEQKLTGREGDILADTPGDTLAFTLDHAFRIQKFNRFAELCLGTSPGTLTGTDFSSLLSEGNLDNWEYAVLQLTTRTRHFFTNLIYKTHHGEYPTFSFLFRAPDDGTLYLTSQRHSFTEQELDQKLSRAMKDIEHHMPSSPGTPQPQNSEEELIHNIAAYIREHIQEPWLTVKGLATKFGINEKKLKSGFHTYYETSVYHYYTNIRMEQALHLLKTTDQSIVQIADSTGYKVLSSFYRSFKQYFGCSPGSIRKNR